jgi:hypothetical protein
MARKTKSAHQQKYIELKGVEPDLGQTGIAASSQVERCGWKVMQVVR